VFGRQCQTKQKTLITLVAARNPATHRGVIAYSAWSSLAHAVVMYAKMVSAFLVVIGAALLVLTPKRSVERILAA
jgi:hypothetical protein